MMYQLSIQYTDFDIPFYIKSTIWCVEILKILFATFLFFYLNVYSLILADKKTKKSLKMFHSSSIDQQGVQRILTRNSQKFFSFLYISVERSNNFSSIKYHHHVYRSFDMTFFNISQKIIFWIFFFQSFCYE